MIVKAWVSMYLVGCTREEEIEISDQELEGMDDMQKQKYVEEIVHDWALERIEWGFEEK